MSIISNIESAFRGISFTLEDAYSVNKDVNRTSVRARIYENIGKTFDKVTRGVYITKEHDCIVIEGDGRNLHMIQDESIDAIITDHPWDNKANKGGNRNFAKYECFEYTVDDFMEKARVLKQGSFLCEVIPNENSTNFDYLYSIKKMAQKAGFEYYAKIPWIKGKFVSNTGRCSKNSEDLMIFSKGKPRALRIDQKKTKALGELTFMSGTNKMLPTDFNVQPVPKKDSIAQSEKPVELFEQVLEYITLENEIVLDQFAGSGAVGIACRKKKRKSILIEKSNELVRKIIGRINDTYYLNNSMIANV